VAFIEKMFSWVDDALDGGGSVLVHCLAGAHRAGTTGILLLMHKGGLGAEQATVAAKAARPIIDPIFDFVDCLSMYERNRSR
jgi:protein-tyrosine phosphatase